MRFYTILKHINKLGYKTFDEFIAVIDNPLKCTSTEHLANIIAFARYTLIHNKRHEASSKAAKERERRYIEEQTKKRDEHMEFLRQKELNNYVNRK